MVEEIAKPDPEANETVRLLGVPVWNPTYEAFKSWFLRESSDLEHATLLGIVNAHSLNLAKSDTAYRECLQSMDRCINDGIGVRLAARMRGCELHYNFNGTDLWPRIFSEAEGLRVYLYGASETSNAGAAAAIQARYPGVEVVGRANGYERTLGPELIEEINALRPNVLLVALGQPKQELELCRHEKDLKVGLACGVGALFDFMSGNVSRAPAAWRNVGLEWLYRLAKEPRRMFRRYVLGNPLFLIRALRHRRRDRKGS